MTKFDMDINQNYASFKLKDKTIFIDSFDNINFDIRVGTIESSEFLTTIIAQSSDELNEKLTEISKKI